MRKFSIHVSDPDIADLNERLDRVRWPDKETSDVQGITLEEARNLVQIWRHDYDWRRFEWRLNSYTNFETTIQGLTIHFIHVRSPHRHALPIVLTHGWPGSIVEFLDCIAPLTDPAAFGGAAEDAFDVVIPSLPGFGLSEHPQDTGWNAERVAAVWAELMSRLGYTRWVAQGGDWGSLITHRLAQLQPRGLIAAHVNLPLVFPGQDAALPTAEEKAAFAALTVLEADGGAYAHLQGTRPQTIAYALADSPVAQAMWMFEKIKGWSGQIDGALPQPLESILDAISLYWFTNSGGSSARFYWEVFRTGFAGYAAGRIEIPMAATIFPDEFYHPPRAWAERDWPNLYYWNSASRGGHFAAWEQPEVFVSEVRAAFRSIR